MNGGTDVHQALYRKWRPKSFDEVCGQEHITSILKYEIDNSKFSHAYLFCGSRGTGKTTCAKILAKAVNCLSPQNGNPCGVCESCLSVEAGVATDVLEMDAASNNGVDNIRDIRDEVIYAPSALKYRVYIIDEVHMLSSSAFNALLKTLEEPPEHVVFILATTELHKLPATIISRCQRFDFRRISTSALSARLNFIAQNEDIEIDGEASLMLAKHAQGGMRDAISLLELCAGARERITPSLVNSVIGSGGRGETVALAEAIAKKDYDAIFAAVAEAVNSSRDLSVFWQDLISLYRDMLIIKTSGNAAAYLDLTDSEQKTLFELAAKFGLETLSYHCRLLEEAFLNMQKANSIKRICAELTLVRMCDSRLSQSNDSLISRIGELEAKMRNIGEAPKSEDKPLTESKRPQRQKRPTYNDSDDEMFRSDAPSKPSEPKKTAPTVGTGRVLKSFKNRAEVLDALGAINPMIAAFYQEAKWYLDGEGKVVLKFESSYSIDSIKMFAGERDFVKALSSVIGETDEKSVLYEVATTVEKSSVIDTIMEAAEENR